MSEVEELKKEIVNLKIRVKRIEEFIQAFPSIRDYVHGVDSSDEPLLEEAIKIVQQHDFASTALIQRRLSLGYARAARILDMLEQEGYVGHAEGAKPRKVLKKITSE